MQAVITGAVDSASYESVLTGAREATFSVAAVSIDTATSVV